MRDNYWVSLQYTDADHQSQFARNMLFRHLPSVGDYVEPLEEYGRQYPVLRIVHTGEHSGSEPAIVLYLGDPEPAPGKTSAPGGSVLSGDSIEQIVEPGVVLTFRWKLSERQRARVDEVMAELAAWRPE